MKKVKINWYKTSTIENKALMLAGTEKVEKIELTVVSYYLLGFILIYRSITEYNYED